MASILQPDQFNERFTLYLDTDGQPVQRSLREMTADEVLTAIDWQTAEANRLERVTCDARGESLLESFKAAGQVPDGVTNDELEQATAAMWAAAEAWEKGARLLELVRANIPNWHQRQKLGMREAIRHWWPGGEAA